MPHFIEKEFRSIINKKKVIDYWFWDRYSINPYQGCLMGCAYCDARSAHYRMPDDFENEIVVKKEASLILDDKLKKARTFLPDVVSLSGVTDPYQAAEKKFRNTRKILQVLKAYQFPVHIITKSDLVLEDLDLLREIAIQNWCTVSVSIPSLNAEVAQIIDGRSILPSKRLEIIKRIKQEAPEIQAGVLKIPIIPYLGDDHSVLTAELEEIKQHYADYVLFGGGVHMRDHQATYFLNHLFERRPDLKQPYLNLFKISRIRPYQGLSSPPLSYLVPIHKTMLNACDKLGLNFRIKRFVPDDYRRDAYLKSEALFQEAYLLQTSGKGYKSKIIEAYNCYV